MTHHKLNNRNTADFGLLLLVFLLSVSVAFGGSNAITKTTLAFTTNLQICQADFEIEDYNGSVPSLGGVTVHNLSEGSYDYLSWDFGDGSFSSSFDNSVDHFYANSGNYTVTLTIWDNDQQCNSSISKSINVIVTNDPCDLSPCVWPGDANVDGKADAYDMLHMGLGFGATGPARNGDPFEWVGQVAEDWDLETGDGVNYKHLDTNGDGIINEMDMIPVIGHYTAMQETIINTENDGPRISLDFDVDTFVINQSTGSFVSLSAGLIIGDADNPVENLHGISLFLEYDTTLTDFSNGISLNYNENSFFGSVDEVIPYGKNIASTKQIDIGLTQKGGAGATGYGRVATVDFIIIIDIIDGRVESEVPFDVPIKGIKAIDADGNIIKLSVDEQAATVIFVNESPITDVKENLLNRKVNVYPNPVKDNFITISLQDLNASSVQCYNTLGQLVKSEAITGQKATVNVADLPMGLYQLEVVTDEGIAIKRLVVE